MPFKWETEQQLEIMDQNNNKSSRKFRFSSFIEGLLSVFTPDVIGTDVKSDELDYKLSSPSDDMKAIERDFVNIGGDIRRAMEGFSR